MDRKNFLLEMRKQGTLKGLMPCFVIVKRNMGGLSGRSNGEFIVSHRGSVLYFQKVSRLFGMLRPLEDFTLDTKEYVCYKLEEKKVRNVISFFKKDGSFFPMEYMTGTKETFSTEDNIRRTLKELEALGLKKMEMNKNA